MNHTLAVVNVQMKVLKAFAMCKSILYNSLSKAVFIICFLRVYTDDIVSCMCCNLYPSTLVVIQINVKRCHSDGCDVRIHMVKVSGMRYVYIILYVCVLVWCVHVYVVVRTCVRSCAFM